MRILFVAAGSLATAFALAPVATAARNAGHAVIMAANDDVVPAITGVGLPAFSVSSLPLGHFVNTDRAGRPVVIPTEPEEQIPFTGRWFGRMAAAWLDPLSELARDWRPDVIVGGTMAYAAGLLAARIGVPYVRHAWDAIEATAIDHGAVVELDRELGELGLAWLPEPELFIDVCPPSLRPPESHPAKHAMEMRWVPVNGQRQLEPWMLARSERPRLCLTTGSRVAHDVGAHDIRRRSYELLRAQAVALKELDIDLVVATPDEAGTALRAEVPGVRAGWAPLDVLAPTCDVIVHHGGGTTSLTAMTAAVPQVAIPQGAVQNLGAQRLSRYGAGKTLFGTDGSPAAIVDACREILGDSSYAGRARALSREIAELALPSQAVYRIAELV
ncbi:nucleotide disphospho-sugar-binding domain-containing protein [Streptomyces sp. NPDC058221]|uniref:nucleotide disphospho-sugar-binding domain-containing protein n=1 Tax=Streptomyces sp. NPDC058221 TaxID=3346388 RepID=UPI0036EBE68C